MAVSNSDTLADVHVGDIGTLFKGRVLNKGVPFNPTSADTKKLVIVTPSGVRLERSATITTALVGSTTNYYLEYETLASDIDAGLHAVAGRYKWQAILTYSDGKVFRSQVESYVIDGDNL